tara:strand:- start:2840 stop:4861 length:2022 start_codon:yes stop_codon:yes gene_type:complete
MRVGIEVGGTFTDLVMSDGKNIKTAKVPSTPASPDEGAMLAIKAAGLKLDEISELIHGSTVATNAVLERKGGRVCFFVTQGTKDLLLIQRHDRRAIYDLQYQKPSPVVPRHHTYEINERIAADGKIVSDLDSEVTSNLVRDILEQEKFDSVAICFLHSYLNPIHERAMSDIISALYPEMPITCSCDVAREFREYERASTTTLAAYVQPVVAGYINRFSEELARRGFQGKFSIMQSNGGRMPAAAITKNAITALFSGPAAGVVGAIRGKGSTPYTDIITLDMGGTSTDVALVSNDQAELTPMTMIDGLPVKTPVVDIVTVGAGGGSIAWVDDGGLLRVGPQSAGATPGPACYGRGGKLPTVTDAHLVRGTLQADSFLGGKMSVDLDAASHVIGEIAKKFNVELAEMADNIIRVAEANIVRAIQQVSTERGSDPREFALVPYGGAGPLHAARVAEDLNIDTVVIPPNAGVLSASGLLLSDYVHYRTQTKRLLLNEKNLNSIKSNISSLTTEAKEYLMKLGIQTNKKIETSLEMRYVGQAFEVPVKLTETDVRNISFTLLQKRFTEAHHKIFEFSKPEGDPVEIISIRVGVGEKTPEFAVQHDNEDIDIDPNISKVDIVERGILSETTTLSRTDLTGRTVSGPVLVRDENSTVYVPFGWQVRLDDFYNIVLTRGSE